MNWDAIGAIGEIVGAIGVVVSVAYLALQVKERQYNESYYEYRSDTGRAEQLRHGNHECHGANHSPRRRLCGLLLPRQVTSDLRLGSARPNHQGYAESYQAD